jgi:erythritol transport system substrate-binding protein
MKKHISVILSMAIFASVLSGCAAKQVQETTGASKESAAPAVTEGDSKEDETTENVSETGQAKGSGSNLIYVITASYATPMFETEARVAQETAEKLGYQVKCVSHDDDLTVQSEIIETAIADKAAGIILDNAGAEGSVEAVKKPERPVCPP